MTFDEALLMVVTITHINTFWPRFDRKVTTVRDRLWSILQSTFWKSLIILNLEPEEQGCGNTFGLCYTPFIWKFRVSYLWLWNKFLLFLFFDLVFFYFIWKNFFSAPILTVMDGFGRELLDQYYKVGSSLEFMCQVDRLPARPLPDIIEWRHGNSKLPKSNSTSGQRYKYTLGVFAGGWAK